MQNVKIHLVLFLFSLIHGANYTISKVVMPEYLTSFGVVSVRMLIATVLFWIAKKFSPLEKIERKDWRLLVLCAFFGTSINILSFYIGLSMTQASHAALIMTLTPIFILILSAFIAKERLSKVNIMGIFIAMIGVVILIFMKGISVGGSIAGDFFVLINALFYAIYLVIVKPLLSKYSPYTLFSYLFLLGSIILVPIGIPSLVQYDWTRDTIKVISTLLYISVAVTFIAITLNSWILKTATSAQVEVYLYLQPILYSIIAIGLGNE